MSGEQKTRIIAISLVVVSAINIALLLMVTGGRAGIAPKAVRFILTCVLSFFLFHGSSWARWLVGILSLLGAIVSLVGLIGLGASSVSVFSVIGIWMILMIPFYVLAAYWLLFDKDVSQHFNPRSDF